MENNFQEMSAEHQIVLDELLSSSMNMDEEMCDNILNEMTTTFNENFIDDFFRDLEIKNEFGVEDLNPIFSPVAITPEAPAASPIKNDKKRSVQEEMPLETKSIEIAEKKMQKKCRNTTESRLVVEKCGN